eukprot:7213282-Pyramimonas_sp.AAC.1
MQQHEAADLPLFLGHLPDLLDEPAGSKFRNSEDPAQELWEEMRAENPTRTKGTKAAPSRWNNVVHRLRADLKNYNQR